jgi:hypothetical protein
MLKISHEDLENENQHWANEAERLRRRIQTSEKPNEKAEFERLLEEHLYGRAARFCEDCGCKLRETNGGEYCDGCQAKHDSVVNCPFCTGTYDGIRDRCDKCLSKTRMCVRCGFRYVPYGCRHRCDTGSLCPSCHAVRHR